MNPKTNVDTQGEAPSPEPSMEPRYVFRLYVTGGAPLSSRAIRIVTQLCETYLRGNYDLEVIDLYQQPWLARDAQLVAAPTLVKELPLPLQRLIGVAEDGKTLLERLGISPGPEPQPPA